MIVRQPVGSGEDAKRKVLCEAGAHHGEQSKEAPARTNSDPAEIHDTH
jgi:hypothetical protein